MNNLVVVKNYTGASFLHKILLLFKLLALNTSCYFGRNVVSKLIILPPVGKYKHYVCILGTFFLNSNLEVAFRSKNVNVYKMLILEHFLVQISFVVRLLFVIQCLEQLICCNPEMSMESQASPSVWILMWQKQLFLWNYKNVMRTSFCVTHTL